MREKINFPSNIKPSFSMLIECFHNMCESDRNMALRNFTKRLDDAKKIVDECTPVLPYLLRVHDELKELEKNLD